MLSLYYGWGLAPHGTVFPIQELKTVQTIEDRSFTVPNCFKLKINGKYLSVDDIIVGHNGVYVLKINGHKSCGLLIEDKLLFSEIKPIAPNMDLVDLFKSEETQELVVSFDERYASNEAITGGKGSSLSLLKRLSQLKNNDFIVPNGFVVTTNAYQILLRENPDLNKAINKLQTISWFVIKIFKQNIKNYFYFKVSK